MSSESSSNPKYFLYIPVWATSQQPTGGSGGSQSSQSAGSSAGSQSSVMSTEGTEGPSSSMSGSGSATESPLSSSGSASASSSSGTEGPSESGSSGASGSSGGSSMGSSAGSSAASSGGGTETGGTGSGGTLPSGTLPSGTGPGGTLPSGTWPSGGGGSSNCLLYGSLVTLADGRRVPIELLSPGDELASLVVPGLKVDVPFKAQYEWMSTWGLAGASVKPARVASVRLGEHEGFYLINGRIKATFEHPFLVRRDETWGFCSAELLRVGDVLVTRHANPADADVLGEEPIVTLERILGRVRTVTLHVPGTNTFLADGVWTHNDLSGPMSQSASNVNSISDSLSASSSGSSSESSSGSKSSGSSFSGNTSGSGSSGLQSPSQEISDQTSPGGFSL